MGDTSIASDILSGVTEAGNAVGKSVTIRRITEGDWVNENQPALGKSTTTKNYTVTAIISKFSERLVDNENIIYGDKEAIIDIDGLDITIQPTDLIIDGSDTWQIVGVPNYIEVAGVPVTVILHLRK